MRERGEREGKARGLMPCHLSFSVSLPLFLQAGDFSLSMLVPCFFLFLLVLPPSVEFE